MASVENGLYISVSQIKCYLSCPMRYRLQHVEGLKPAFVPLSLAFGTIHPQVSCALLLGG